MLDIRAQNEIDRPGFYAMPEPVYHKDPCVKPSLSSSIGRKLINESPLHAWTDHPRLNPHYEEKPPQNRFEYGSACHRIVLGKGAELEVLPFDDYRTKDAKAAREAAIAAGKTPIKQADHERAILMANAFFQQLRAFPPEITEPFSNGDSEVVFGWQEREFWCRAMADKLFVSDERIVLYDYKTSSTSVSPYAIGRRIFDMNYDFQLSFYRRGLETLLQGEREFAAYFICQEVDPPFALSVVELSHEAWVLASKKVLAALSVWEQCLAADFWPGFPPLVATATVPSWHEQKWLEREINDELLTSADPLRFAKPIDRPGKPIAGPC